MPSGPGLGAASRRFEEARKAGHFAENTQKQPKKMDDDGFTLVKKRGKIKGNTSFNRIRYTQTKTRATQWRLQCNISEYENKLKVWKLPHQIVDIIRDWLGKDKVTMACLGSGSPSTSLVSQWQLALGIAILKQVNPSGNLLVHDPCFTDLDFEMVQSFPIHLLRCGSELPQTKLLMYMPHCDAELYEIILNTHALESICIIGNSQSHYRLRSNMTTLQATPTISRLVDDTVEFALPKGDWDGVEGGRVFNDTSIHLYHSQKQSEK